MAENELEVIANTSLSTILCSHFYPLRDPDFQHSLVERNFSDLVQGYNSLAMVIGRARNADRLGNLDVIQMDFKPVGGNETKLLILHIPTRSGVSVSNIIRKQFAGVNELLIVQNPLLEGKVLVVAAPYYVNPAMLQPCVEGAVKPLGKYAEIARCHLNLEKSERALRIAEAALNSCEMDLEAYLVKGQAASDLQLYKVAMETYEAALSLVREGGVEHADISERFVKVKTRLKQALHGKFDEVLEGELVDYVSELIEIQALGREDPDLVKHTGVFAREPVAAGEVLVVSNGIEEGSNAFAMVFDACGKSSRLRKQVELLWFYTLHGRVIISNLPDIISSFRPPEFSDCDDDILLNVSSIWCPTVRARMKGNGSSLWTFPCFFHEVAEDLHNVEVQVKGRTMVLRARRDIEAGEELEVPAKQDVVQTRLWCQDGMLVKEEITNGGERVMYYGRRLLTDPPPETEWNLFIEGPCTNYMNSYPKGELDNASVDEIVAWLAETCPVF